MIYEMFPEEYIQLDKELRSGFHPKLEAILSRFGPDDLDMKMAQTAAYCEVALDGTYTLPERTKLCDILLKKLILLRQTEKERSLIILN